MKTRSILAHFRAAKPVDFGHRIDIVLIALSPPLPPILAVDYYTSRDRHDTLCALTWSLNATARLRFVARDAARDFHRRGRNAGLT